MQECTSTNSNQPSNLPGIHVLWAKSRPYQSLLNHLVETGMCAQALLSKNAMRSVGNKLTIWMQLSEEEVMALVGYLAAVHDIGKCHPFFQAKDTDVPGYTELLNSGMLNVNIPSQSIKSFRHEQYSADVLKRVLASHIKIDSPFWRGILAAIALHHQGKKNDSFRPIQKALQPSKWEALQDQLHEQIIAHFKPPLAKAVHCSNADATVYSLMGIIILADWIASDDGTLDALGEHDELPKEILSIIAEHGLCAMQADLPHESFVSLWMEFQANQLRGVQKTAERLGAAPSMLYLIEAPMGEGKSEAALYLAACQIEHFNIDGLYMALPTAATGNQMFHRVNRLFDAHRIPHGRLLHATAWMIDDRTPDNANGDEPEITGTKQQWLAPLRRGMLSQFAVGTVDQAMMAALKVKYGVLRLLGLAGKVLVLDEIHAYDTYMQTIIEQLLLWCHALGVPIILLSATLPLEKKRSLLRAYGASNVDMLSTAYPLITALDENGHVSETVVDHVHMHRNYTINMRPFLQDADKTANLACELVQDGGNICVLVNTVKRAQEVYQYLKERASVSVRLFHARFPAIERQRIETECVETYGKEQDKRPHSSILVATQVMEQSIDADFDAMITDLAPIDLLLQRMGRVHRFDHTQRPKHMNSPHIYVLTDPSGYERNLYAGILMQRTETLLQDKSILTTPDDIRPCVEAVYTEETPEEATEFELWAKNRFSNQLDAAKARGASLDPPQFDYPGFSQTIPEFLLTDDPTQIRSARTRLGEESERIILIPKEEISSIPSFPNREQARKLLERSVAVRTSHFGTVPEDAVKGRGLLAGCTILPTENGIAHWGEYLIWNDPELGTITEKER